MKGLFLFLVISTIGGSAYADSKVTCELQANHWFNTANLGQAFEKEMTYEECLEKGQTLFDSIVSTGSSVTHVIKNKVTERSWTEKYKSVKIKYYAQDGSVIKTTLKRNDSEKSAVVKRTYDIESGWRCWTEGECDEKK
jgi:hypothetical protein